MNDERFLKDLISFADEPCKNFCKNILNKSITIDVSYDNYVFLTLLLLKYLDPPQD